MARLLARAFMVAALAASSAMPTHADEWTSFATISETMGINTGRVCVGDASKQDIGCPTYAPTISSAGLLTATAISATTINGQYASFTTLTVGGEEVSGGGGSGNAGDRISTTNVSSGGNLAMVVAGNGGTVSFTTGGVEGTAYLTTAGLLVTPGISATTNRTSVTTLYASGNVGIGLTEPLWPLHVSTSANNGFAARFDQTNTTASQGVVIQTGTASNGDFALLVKSNNGNTYALVVRNSANVGIGTSTPNTSLTVVGEVQVSSSGVACGSSTRGAIRYNGSRLQYCNNSGWVSLSESGSAAYTTPGSYSFTVPTFSTLSVKVVGGGGGGACGNFGGNSGVAGAQSSFNSTVVGGGGGAGVGYTPGNDGAGGTASGGTTNTNGNAGSSGTGGASVYGGYGTGGTRGSGGLGGGGGSGGYAKRAYEDGDLTPGASITVIVGSGGAGGSGCGASNGNAGGNGAVVITWSG